MYRYSQGRGGQTVMSRDHDSLAGGVSGQADKRVACGRDEIEELRQLQPAMACQRWVAGLWCLTIDSKEAVWHDPIARRTNKAINLGQTGIGMGIYTSFRQAQSVCHLRSCGSGFIREGIR